MSKRPDIAPPYMLQRPPKERLLRVVEQGSFDARGNDALLNNAAAVQVVANLLRSTYGSAGMAKLVLNKYKQIDVTDDASTVLTGLKLQHPVARFMADLALYYDMKVGDGSTTVVLFADALMQGAVKLARKGIHPSIVADGYDLAFQQSMKLLKGIAFSSEPLDVTTLERIAATSLKGRLVLGEERHLARLAALAVSKAAKRTAEGLRVDLADIKLAKRIGRSVRDSVLVEGIVLEKELLHPHMPKRIENPRIALLGDPIEVERVRSYTPDYPYHIDIDMPEQISEFDDWKSNYLKKMVDGVAATGANVLIFRMATRSVDEIAQNFLAKKGIMAVRAVSEDDMLRLTRATKGRLVTVLRELTAQDLGKARLAEEREVGGMGWRWLFIEGCEEPGSVTILIRGANRMMLDEAERALHDAMAAARLAVERPEIVAGGGAAEVLLASRLREWAPTVKGRRQLAVMAFADALESLASTLASNLGIDPIDTVAGMRREQEKGGAGVGIHGSTRSLRDLIAEEVVEPAEKKVKSWGSAVEAAIMLLRIDRLIILPQKEELARQVARQHPAVGTPAYSSMHRLPWLYHKELKHHWEDRSHYRRH